MAEEEIDFRKFSSEAKTFAELLFERRPEWRKFSETIGIDTVPTLKISLPKPTSESEFNFEIICYEDEGPIWFFSYWHRHIFDLIDNLDEEGIRVILDEIDKLMSGQLVIYRTPEGSVTLIDLEDVESIKEFNEIYGSEFTAIKYGD